MSWSNNILRLRTRLGLTQKQVADAIGATVQTISNWETGRSEPLLKIPQVLALCKILQCSLEELDAAMRDNPKTEEDKSE